MVIAARSEYEDQVAVFEDVFEDRRQFVERLDAADAAGAEAGDVRPAHAAVGAVDTAGGVARVGDHPVRVVREDPDHQGLLYAGTDFGLFISFDDGANWKRFNLNLPAVPVHGDRSARQRLLHEARHHRTVLGALLAFLPRWLGWTDGIVHERIKPFLNSFPSVGWAILAAFSVLWVALGWWFGRGADDLEGFMLAGRRVGLALEVRRQRYLALLLQKRQHVGGKVEREQVVTFVKTSVLESYRNGVKKGKTDAGV